MLIKKSKSLLLALSFLSFGGCIPKTDKIERSDYSTATQMMEEGQYSSAIHIMEGRLKHAPFDQKARLLLAAAYAGRAGVHITDFFDFAQELDKVTKLSQKYGPESSLGVIQNLKSRTQNRDQKNALELLEGIYNALFQLNNFLRAFELVPSLKNAASVQDLNAAIHILDGDSKLTGGSALYRGLLRVVLLKHDTFSANLFKSLGECQINTQAVEQDLRYIQHQTIRILSDLYIGSGSEAKKAQTQKQLNSIDEAFQKALDLTATLTPVNHQIDISQVTHQLGGQCP